MGKISSKGYLFNWRLHLLPVAVWLGTVVCVIGLFSYRARRFEVLGMAQGQIRQVAATCPGRIISIPVELFDEVKKGQIVAVLDTILEDVNRPEDIKAQLATISAEIEHLSAQLIAAQETLIAEKTDRETNRLADQRRFSADVDNARLQILSLRAQIASDQIMLDDLAMEVKIVEDLLNKGAVAAYELEKAKVQHESLAKKVEENGRLLEEAQNDLKEALQRQQEYARTQPYHPSVDSVLEVIRKEIKVQERLMDELLVQHKPLELKSPIDGVVVQVPGRANETLTRRPGEKVLRRAGEVVGTGEPIVAIAETHSREIVAYVSARQLGRLQDKMTVEVVKDREPAQIAMAQVVSVGPVMELMPEQLWRNPNIPQWGLPIMIKVPPGLKVIPGEVVGVRGL